MQIFEALFLVYKNTSIFLSTLFLLVVEFMCPDGDIEDGNIPPALRRIFVCKYSPICKRGSVFDCLCRVLHTPTCILQVIMRYTLPCSIR